VIYRQLAQSFIADDKPEYAVKALRTVKKLLPYDREVHFQLAELNFQRGQLNEALGELGELADHYEENNQLEETVEVLKEMVRLAPNNIPVRDKLSNIYMKRGYIDDGLKELDELSELQRKNGRLRDAVKTLQRAAETYWMMAKQDKAYELYDRIVRISPGDVEARQQLVNLHILAGRIKDAVEEQRTIAQICLQSRGPKEAIGALHQVISLAPDDTRAYFALAQVLSDTGEFGQAYRLYGRILKIAPDNVKAKNLQDQIKSKAVAAGQIPANAT
jgi:tetratricopeptide (TPR) repeat protein